MQNLKHFRRFGAGQADMGAGFDSVVRTPVPPALEDTSMVRIIAALILAVTAARAFSQEPARLVDDPPDRHVVVPGDTLWGISGKFLKEPWRWPELWHLNQEQIKNPHRIYPGDIVLLDMSSGQPQFKIATPVKATPQVYSEGIRKEIPSIPPNVIEPFISQPLIVDADGLMNAPRIVASQEDRVFLGNGDNGFVTGITGIDIVNWQVYRPGKPLKDPENGEIIGYEAFFLGNAKLIQPGEPATVRITVAKEEIDRGDRLVPASPPNLQSYVPHQPAEKVDGRIMSIYGGVDEAGRYSIISLNRGSKQGLELGHVVALYRNRVSLGYDENGKRVSTPIPEERYALAFVFRTFERVSYALVMEATKPVIVGDVIRNP